MFDSNQTLNNCSMPSWYWTTSDAMFQFTYQYFTVIYVLFGLTGDSICLLICCQEAKKEGAYWYQIVLTISHICEIITGGISYAGSGLYGMIGNERTGAAADWYRSSYVNIWYFAHLASPLVNAFISCSVLLSVCMAADRVLAVAKPFAYRSYNHKTRQICCFVFCFVLGFATSAFDMFRRRVIEDRSGMYLAAFDTDYTSRPYVNVLSHLRNVIRIVALVTLVSLNGALIYFYKLHMRQLHDVAKNHGSSSIRKRQSDKTLLILAVYQSVSTTVTMTFLVIYYFLFYNLAGFSTCGIFLMAPITDFAVAFVYAFDFYAVLLMSKRFRRLTWRCFTKGPTPLGTAVVPLEPNANMASAKGS